MDIAGLTSKARGRLSQRASGFHAGAADLRDVDRRHRAGTARRESS